ncbi:MAG: DUF3999 family protein [Planctomycetia bacterium]|nr:DUF3999 family protein [Planctomycetia bacterium]
MKNNLKLSAVMIGLLVISVLHAESQLSSQFRFWKAVERDKKRGEEIVAFALSSDIYAATRIDLPDIRIVDSTGTEAPYTIEKDVQYRQEQSRETVTTQIVSLKPINNSIEVHLKIPEKITRIEGFQFVTPLTNFERKVQIAGSPDGQQWTPLVTKVGIIFDYSRYMDVNNREIALPKNTFREFKITLDDVIDELESPFSEIQRTIKDSREDQRTERKALFRRTFRIDRIDCWYTVTRDRMEQDRTTVYEVADFNAQDQSATKQTILTVRTHREPIRQLTLETPSRNFSRRVVIEVPVDIQVRASGPQKREEATTKWRSIGETTISRLRLRDQNREELTITFPEHREEQYRIVVHNEDNPPLQFTGVQLEGTVQRVLFLAQPDRDYRVFYGSPSVPTPHYEAATVLSALRKDEQPVVVKLGKANDNVDYREDQSHEKVPVPGLINNWIFFGTAILLMVVVLGWMLFRAGQRLEQLPKDS